MIVIKSEEELQIQKGKIYYKQKEVIQELHKRTNCSTDDVTKILNSLGDMVKDKFSDKDNFVEIKLFPGLKVTSRFIPSEQSVSKRLNIESNYSVFMSATFTDAFRKKVRESYEKAKIESIGH